MKLFYLQRGKSIVAHLPQKWLFSMLTMLLFAVSSGRVLADDVLIWKVDFQKITADNNITAGTSTSTTLGDEVFKERWSSADHSFKKLLVNGNAVSDQLVVDEWNGNWQIYRYSLFNQSTGDRWIGIANCKAGQLVVVVDNLNNNDGSASLGDIINLEKVSADGNTTTYRVLNTGNVRFVLHRYGRVGSVALYAPSTCTNTDHAVWPGSTVGTGSDAFNTAFSQFYELESGNQYHFTFHIDGGDQTWKNWYLQAAKSKVHNGDSGWDGQELIWVRADKYGASELHLYKGSMSAELNQGNQNVSTFDASTDADLRNANVDMTVSYADNKLFVFAKTTGTASGTTYYLTGTKNADNGGSPIQLFFGVEKAKITNLTAEKRVVYKETVHLENGQGTGRIAIDDIDAPFYSDANGDKISYMANGTNIKIYATPGDGWQFERIGSVYNNPRTFTTREQNDVFNLNFVQGGVKYELNGGEGKNYDPLKQEITLPAPTKDGYTFIGWMTASNGTTPDAGKAGDKKTYNANTSLYALWYKNNCEIDFTANGPLSGTPSKAGASISETGVFMAGGTPVGNITINSYAIDSRFGVQTGTSWIYYNGGLYSNNSGGRACGVNGCEEGDYITISSSANPNVNAADAEFVYQDGNTYVYKVKKAGGVKFTPARNTVLYSVAVASPCNHRVWTDGNVANETSKAGWWYNFSPFYKIEKGKTLNFEFTIHGGETSLQNWCLIAQANQKHNGDLGLSSTGYERLIVRADGYNLDAKNRKEEHAAINKNDSPITVNSGWGKALTDADFANDNKNAKVSIKAEYTSAGILNITATTVGNGTTYVLTTSSTAITEDVIYLTLEAEQSWIEGITHPIKFADTTPTITTSSTGTITYSQPALGNPEGTWVKYEVVSSTGVDNPSISQIEGSPEYFLNTKGTGTVTVQATCGGHTAEYTLTVDGLMFENPSPYIAHGKTEYDAPLTGGAEPDKVEIVKYDTTPCLRGAKVKFEGGTCKIYDIPNGADDGGIIVIRATKGDAVAECCLTVAYDLHVWNMYSDPLVYGSLVEGNAKDAVTGDGDTMNEKSRVGSAHYVVFDPSKSYTYVKPGNEEDETSQDESKTNNNRVEYNNWLDGQDYYYKENWYNDQSGVKTCNADGGLKDYDLLHKYWRFTYKTCQYVNGVRTYVNEPLFAYKNTVIGDNGRIIKQTAGLRYNAPALHFGVSDNDTRDSEGGSTAVREQDRCVILKVGSRLCIPRVKEGRYIRIHWYRHSDNNGDRCRITNGEDLDGKVIDPYDVIRFTGSHYYNDHKGSFVFRVKKHSTTTDAKNFETVNGETYCDVFIDPYGLGWTEFYRIEVMDKFNSELQISEVDVAEKITADQIVGKRTQADVGKPQATTDSWNSHDLNDAVSYNRNVFDAEKANHPVLASQLTSRIQTHAKGAGLVSYAPELYISGYPGHCFTWNGWLNTTLQADFMGTSASCDITTKTDGLWSLENTIPAEAVWVGNNLQYTMHPLKHVKGEGVIKLTLRTHSGWTGEAHYTFDKREAIVAVGQYSVQDYPYTWDFTDYNFGKNNAYGGKTYTTMSDAIVNVEKQYGYWRKVDDAWQMGAYQNRITSKYSNNIEVKDDDKKVNLPKFAQGSQLALGTNQDKHTILETEGLRINIPAVNTSNNSAVVLNPTDGTRKGTLTVNGTITVPEVQKGMFVFVRSANKPTSVIGAVDKNDKGNKPGVINSVADNFSFTAATVSMAQQDVLDNVWVYEQTTEGMQDVVITPNGAVEAIGVTDYFKLMTIASGAARSTWVTDSREERIDYNNSGLFTNHNLQSYVVKSKSEVDADGEGHTDLTPAQVIPGADETAENRGLVLYDDVAEGATTTPRPLIPLFVPACNIQNDDIVGNRLVDHIEEGQVDVPDTDYNTMRYILTNAYYDYDKANKTLGSEVKHAEDICFYVLRQGSNMRANSSYLDVDRNEASGIKMLYLTFDAIGDEETGIHEVAVEVDKETIDTASFYTLSGVKLSGAPTKRGIYIMNGKKVFVSK